MKSNRIMVRLDEYINYKHSLGFKLYSEEGVLRNFARYTLNLEYDGPVTREMVMDWISACVQCDKTMARRLEAIKPFVKYLQSFDNQTESISDLNYGNGHTRPTPYIYSKCETVKIMEQCKELYSPDGIRSRTVATVIGTLWATGLRPTEVTNLRIRDVDLSEGVIHIRNTKFSKERYVPVDRSVSVHLIKYKQWIEEKTGVKGSDKPFFYTTGGNPLTERSLSYAFNLIRDSIDATPVGYPNVRLYDFRHTMACRTIQKWTELGIDVSSHLHILSTFMGHVKPEGTYWYISATPGMLNLSCAKYEEMFGGADDEF